MLPTAFDRTRTQHKQWIQWHWLWLWLCGCGDEMTHKPGYFTSEFWTNNFNFSIYSLSHSSAPQISVVSWARKTIFRFLFSCFFPPLALSLSFIDRTAKSFGHLFEALVAGNRICVFVRLEKLLFNGVEVDTLCANSSHTQLEQLNARPEHNYRQFMRIFGSLSEEKLAAEEQQKNTNSLRFHQFYSARVQHFVRHSLV